MSNFCDEFGMYVQVYNSFTPVFKTAKLPNKRLIWQLYFLLPCHSATTPPPPPLSRSTVTPTHDVPPDPSYVPGETFVCNNITKSNIYSFKKCFHSVLPVIRKQQTKIILITKERCDISNKFMMNNQLPVSAFPTYPLYVQNAKCSW